MIDPTRPAIANTTGIDPELRRAQQRFVAELARIDWALHGSITHRMMRCGKRHCRCKKRSAPVTRALPAVDPHRRRQSVTKLLNAEQLDRYQHRLVNADRLRRLVSDLEALTRRTPSVKMSPLTGFVTGPNVPYTVGGAR